MIDQRPLDSIKVEDHPEIELRKEDGRTAPHLVIRGVGVATHIVREKVHHSATPTDASPRRTNSCSRECLFKPNNRVLRFQRVGSAVGGASEELFALAGEPTA
jgi:hypothetical protein